MSETKEEIKETKTAKKSTTKGKQTEVETKATVTEQPKTKETKPATESEKQNIYANLFNGKWSVGKIAVIVVLATMVLYFISSILAIIGIASKLVFSLQGICAAMSLAIVGYIGWTYAKTENMKLKKLYVVALLVVYICIIIPILF